MIKQHHIKYDGFSGYGYIQLEFAIGKLMTIVYNSDILPFIVRLPITSVNNDIIRALLIDQFQPKDKPLFNMAQIQ